MCGTRGLFHRAVVFACHAGNGFDAGFDIAGDAALLVGCCGDGIQAMADLGHRTIGGLQDAGNRSHGSLAAFQMLQTFLDAAPDGDRLGAQRGGNRIDLTGRAGRFFCQLAHLVGNHGEAAALFAGASGFDRGIERQQIGLFGDVLDLAGHVGDRLGAAYELVDRAGHFLDGLFDNIHFTKQYLEVATAFVGALQAFLRLVLDMLGALGDRGNTRNQLLDRCGCIVRFFILLVRALRNAVCVIREGGDAGRYLRCGVAYLADQLVEVLHHLVEDERSLADFILALDRQAPGQVTFAAGDVGQPLAQFVERYGDEVVGQQIDDDEQDADRSQCDAGNLDAESGDIGFDGVERNLHADNAEHRAFGHLVAEHAILAEVVFGSLGRVDHVQVGVTVAGFDREIRNAGGHDLLLERVELAGLLGVGAVELDDRFTTGDVQILDDRQLLDLVEEYLALTYRAGDHHAGQAGHGHFMDALREILSLPDGRVAINLRSPDDDDRPDDGQCQPDGSRQAYPYFHVTKPRHCVPSIATILSGCQVYLLDCASASVFLQKYTGTANFAK